MHLLQDIFKIQQKKNYQINCWKKIDRIDFQENVLVWVQFTDKGDNVDFYINNPQLYLTDRAIHRRIIKSENENLVNETDVPVNYEYIDDLQKNGFENKE